MARAFNPNNPVRENFYTVAQESVEDPTFLDRAMKGLRASVREYAKTPEEDPSERSRLGQALGKYGIRVLMAYNTNKVRESVMRSDMDILGRLFLNEKEARGPIGGFIGEFTAAYLFANKDIRANIFFPAESDSIKNAAILEAQVSLRAAKAGSKEYNEAYRRLQEVRAATYPSEDSLGVDWWLTIWRNKENSSGGEEKERKNVALQVKTVNIKTRGFMLLHPIQSEADVEYVVTEIEKHVLPDDRVKVVDRMRHAARKILRVKDTYDGIVPALLIIPGDGMDSAGNSGQILYDSLTGIPKEDLVNQVKNALKKQGFWA